MKKRPPRDQKWSEWSNPKYKDLPVTRGELVTLLVHFKQQLIEDSLLSRLKRFLAIGWHPRRTTGEVGGPAKPADRDRGAA